VEEAQIIQFEKKKNYKNLVIKVKLYSSLWFNSLIWFFQ